MRTKEIYTFFCILAVQDNISIVPLHTTMMNVFERLPVEIILQILQHTGDYFGVDSLFHVSPRVNAIFKANSRFVLENTLAS